MVTAFCLSPPVQYQRLRRSNSLSGTPIRTPTRLYARTPERLTPLHHCTTMEVMRLTVNLESDLYALAKSLAKAEDCSISVAVNRLLRRSLSGAARGATKTSLRTAKRNGFVISRGKRPVTADTVRQIEEDDET